MKEFPNESKNKWTRIFKKKWFFPALYIVIAAFLLTGVVWYQNAQSNMIEGLDDVEQTDMYNADLFEEEAKSVLQQKENIKMPVKDEMQTEIVTKFYDYNAEEEDQEKGLTLYNNRYYQSTGIDIASSDGEPFDVVASLSGTVTEVKEDPLLGNVVVMSHGDGISTYYASLGEVTVEPGKEIEQGDGIGTAGKNLFSEDSGNHVHFEIRKGETEVDPEQFFNESLDKVVDYDVEEMDKEHAKEDNADSEEIEAEEEEFDKETTTETDLDTDEEEDSEANKDLSFSVPA